MKQRPAIVSQKCIQNPDKPVRNTQQSSDMAGRLRALLPHVLADEIIKVLGELEGYTPPESKQDWTCVGASQCIRALCALVCESNEPTVIDSLAKALFEAGATKATWKDNASDLLREQYRTIARDALVKIGANQ